MRALVVDDEPLVRSELVYALERVVPEADVTEAGDAVEALRELARTPYDVVFLDINLPGLNGLEATRVIAALPAPPQVVFVTADDSRALAAFDVAAADYLVKPVSEERLLRAVERVRAQRAGSAGSQQDEAHRRSRVALEDGERTRLVRIDEIRYVQANGHVVTARVFEGDLRWRGSLSDCAGKLEPLGFLRCHRAYLVNPERVIEVEPYFGGSYLLRVDDRARSEVPVSRSFLPAVRKALGL
jgi:DNA-binding LytR/AlgR family response regulator